MADPSLFSEDLSKAGEKRAHEVFNVLKSTVVSANYRRDEAHRIASDLKIDNLLRPQFRFQARFHCQLHFLSALLVLDTTSVNKDLLRGIKIN